MSRHGRFPGRWASFWTFGKVEEGWSGHGALRASQAADFWLLDPRTIARDDTKVRFTYAKGKQTGDIVGSSGRDRRGELKVCAPDNDFANLARSSLRERAESYAKSLWAERGKSAKQRQGRTDSEPWRFVYLYTPIQRPSLTLCRISRRTRDRQNSAACSRRSGAGPRGTAVGDPRATCGPHRG